MNTPLSLSLPQERIVEASNLAVIIDAYLADRRKSVSPEALTNYEIHMRRFMEWWNTRLDIHQHQLSRETMESFVSWLKSDYRNVYGQPATPYNVSRTLIQLRRVLRWAFSAGCVNQDISELVPSVDAKKKPKYYPKSPDLERMLNACSGVNRVRNMALWAMLISTGARRMEISNAKIEDVTFDCEIGNLSLAGVHSGIVHFRIVKNDSGGDGPGRHSIFCSKSGLLLKLWLLLDGRMNGNIFTLQDTGIRKAINDSAAAVGIDRMHPHACRSAFISYWARRHAKAGPMADVALRLQVGHALNNADAQTHYLSDDLDWRLELIREFYVSPMDDIDVDWARLPVQR